VNSPYFLLLLGGYLVTATAVGGCRCAPQRAIQGSVTEEWAVSYKGPGDGGGAASAVAVDGQGNVYATGSWRTKGDGEDYLTVKYDAQGHMLWAAQYNGPGNADDDAEAVAVDQAGNAYVAGTINQTGFRGSTGDYGLVKYDASGVEQWVAVYTLGEGGDMVHALALDGQGNVYVSGTSDGGHGAKEDFATIKYDARGNQLWVARYNGLFKGPDEAWDMTVDEAGNVYVTGGTFSGSDVSGDFLTVKYSTDGVEQWVARYDGPAMGGDSAHAIAVDRAGNVYVTGRVTGFGSRTFLAADYATVKYDAQGNQLWVSVYDGPQGGDDWPEAVAVDGGGNVYVTGSSDDLADEGPDYATVKYDALGNQLWVARYSGPGHTGFGSSLYDDEPRDLALDGVGNVYVTGQSRMDGSGLDWVTIKYNPDGAQQWFARYDGPDGGDDFADALAVDGSGNVYVAGIARPDGFTVVKYSQEASTP
jgi:hypothetical protein